MTLAQSVRSRRITAVTLALVVCFAVGGLGRSSARARAAGGGAIAPPSGTELLLGTGRTTTKMAVANFLPPCSTVTISNTITTLRNNIVTAPIMVDDLTGRGVLSFDFNVIYDPAVLTAPVVDNTGTLSSQMTITVNPNIAGLLRVSGFYEDFLVGSGTLLNIRFTAIGPIGSGSDLNFSPFKFNEGDPCSVASNGHVTIISGTVAGSVTYSNAQSPPVPVPYTVLNATGSVNTSTNTDLSGNYSFGGFGSGAYTITPSKIGDVNGITAFDSALIAQEVVHLITLSPTQLLASDVSQNNVVTTFDAALIAQYVVNIPNVGNTGSWIFTPVDRGYADVESNYISQDYGAILMGEVSGNWLAPTMRTNDNRDPVRDARAAVNVSVPQIDVRSYSEVEVPIDIADITGLGIVSFQFELNFDPRVIQSDGVVVHGTISDGMSVIGNEVSPGRIKFSGFTAVKRSGAGALVKLRFRSIGPVGSASKIKITNFFLNEDPKCEVQTGNLTIVDSVGRTSRTPAVQLALGVDLLVHLKRLPSTTGN